MSGVEAIAHALAGSTGGIVAMTLLYPLENIRTRLQVQVQRRQSIAANNAANPTNQSLLPVHTCQAFKPNNNDDSDQHEVEECISPETPHQTKQPSTNKLLKSIAPDSSSQNKPTTYFSLQAPKMTPLTPPCLACIIESGHTSSSSPSASPGLHPISHPIAPSYEFHGSLDVIRKVWAREGWRKLYSGLESALIGVGASSAVYFFFYYTFKSIVLARSGSTTMGPIANLGVASVAGIVNVFITLPIWLVNTRMAVAPKGEYSSVWDAVCKIYEEENLLGFYRGLVPSLILVSNPAIQFVVYEQMIGLYLHQAKKAAAAVASSSASAAMSASPVTRLSSIQYFLLGAFAKAVATLATYPYQVVKSRLQASRSSHTTWSMIANMWSDEGISSFYRGMNAKMSQTVLNSAFMFAVYERLVRFILKFLNWCRTEYRRLPKPAP